MSNGTLAEVVSLWREAGPERWERRRFRPDYQDEVP